ncbi:MAG TPA: VacJ family lipoprotein [Acetobacteraceae bacterium]|nr:VacJ family lipoprotein [Acetobacteraceae bacterium]
MRVFFRTAPLWLTWLVMLGLTGCAKPPPASDPDALAYYRETNDPLEPFNRKMYAVNNALDAAILKPVAQGYVAVVPDAIRDGIHNVLGNLTTPVKLSNDMLEGKPRRAGDTYMRFLINTTVGCLGFFDVAAKWGYPDHDADFGMTLAKWGVHPGPYLYLPILGPNDPRDFAGFGVDIAADPFTWVGQGAAVTALGYSRWAVTAVDARSRLLGTLSNVKKTALDPYATFRSLYRQHRRSQIQEMENDNRATVPAWFQQPTPAH